MKTSSVLSVAVTLAAMSCFLPMTAEADFQVAYTTAVEQRPAIAHCSQTGKFLVAYAIQYDDGLGHSYYGVQCQLHNADGSKSGPVLYPFGDLGVIAGLADPHSPTTICRTFSSWLSRCAIPVGRMTM